VALPLRRLDDRLVGIRAASDRLLEALPPAAEEHVDAVVDLLLGDRARPARRCHVPAWEVSPIGRGRGLKRR
jgi:hypothetical protein